MSSPHEVLGLGPHASPEEIAQAYRELAKLHHPDVAGDEGVPRMQEINAAYDLLRDSLVDQQRERVPERPRETPRFDPALLRRLGAELVAALEPGEDVLLTADAATWDAHDVRLAVTDRRLLWLRDDAISDRVRSQRYAQISAVEGRQRRRLRRVGELRVETVHGRRLSFSELRPERLDAVLRTLRPLVAEAQAAA